MEINLTRINKFLSESGFCSRREADKLLEEGRITINGIVPEMGTKVSIDDEVRVDGKLVREKREKHIYLAFNKPVGIECTTNQSVRDNIVDYINYPKRIFPIGRLDKASEGLIFMTDDGDIVNKILRARNNHEKEYVVTVNKEITDRFIQKMSNGVPILDTVTRKCKVEQISKFVFRIILTQGLNRQIRRMCEYLDYEVTALKRTRIINISLDVHVGRYRDLTDDEIKQLNKLIEPSSKTEEASLSKSTKVDFGNSKIRLIEIKKILIPNSLILNLEMLKTILYIAIGGAIGSVLRFLTTILVSKFWSNQFPLATFIANIFGCFLIGLFIGILAKNNLADSNLKWFLVTGFCGGFTTFSAFGMENYNLFQSNNSLLAFGYIALSIILGLFAVWFGFFVSK